MSLLVRNPPRLISTRDNCNWTGKFDELYFSFLFVNLNFNFNLDLLQILTLIRTSIWFPINCSKSFEIMFGIFSKAVYRDVQRRTRRMDQHWGSSRGVRTLPLDSAFVNRRARCASLRKVDHNLCKERSFVNFSYFIVQKTTIIFE